MERGDLLNVNGGIFKPQGRAIAEHAASDVRVLVVGNPCNTNCLIARSNAPGDPGRALVRHDPARREPGQGAAGQQGRRRRWRDVTNLAIWGNHSATQFPDFANARIGGKPVPEVIGDEAGSGATSSRPCRSGAPPSSTPGARRRPPRPRPRPSTPWSRCGPRRPPGTASRWPSASTGQYGAPEGLQFGFPVASDGKGGWSVVERFARDDFASERIGITTDELLAERDEVKALGLI